ncbi:hypothetical protein OHA10_22025 [Kribbella sp. NBC_00662]|uniref:hypothetical protein n=1 Tax=Kribbella sp. NBC_00662 TaxID=2975969 RepID=UPI003253573D
MFAKPTSAGLAAPVSGLADQTFAGWPGGQAPVQESDFFGRERSGWVLGFGFDGVDFAGGVRGAGAVADGEFHGACAAW